MWLDSVYFIKLEHIYIKNLNYSKYKNLTFQLKLESKTLIILNSYWGYLNKAGFILVFNLN